MSEEKSISEQLRQAREEQQQTIAEMHRLTGVSPNVLQGLEKGDFEVVEPVFMRMGLRTYAEHLGLDVTAITQVYDKEFNAPPEPPPEAVQPSPSTPSLPFSISPQIRRIGLAAGLVIFIVILAALLGSDEPEPDVSTSHLRSSAPVARKPLPKRIASDAQTPSRAIPSSRPAPRAKTPPDIGPLTLPAPETETSPPKAQSAPPPPPQIETVAAPQTATAQRLETTELPTTESPTGTAGESAAQTTIPVTPPAATTTTPAPTAADDSFLVLRFEAVKEVWVRVQGDGRILFEQTVAAGFASRDLQAHNYFQVTSGKPHGLRYWFQGEPLGENGLLGAPNRVLHFRASKEGVVLQGPNPQPPSTVRDTLP